MPSPSSAKHLEVGAIQEPVLVYADCAANMRRELDIEDMGQDLGWRRAILKTEVEAVSRRWR
jgi:hypothetical protein